MGLTRDRGRYYWVKRVPTRYQGLVIGRDGKPVTQVRQALHTDSLEEARHKAAQVEAARLAEWEALAAGDGASARRHYEAARNLAAANGYPYIPVAQLAEGNLAELVSRVLALAGRDGETLEASPAKVEALLGGVPEVLPTFTEVWEDHAEATRTARLRKSPGQEKRWRQARELALRNFLEVTGGDKAVDRITRDDARAFRDHLAERVAAGGYSHSAANKQIGALSVIWREWTERQGLTLDNPFRGLHLSGGQSGRRPPFSRAWVRDRLLAPGALDRLNPEARDILLVMVNTGLGVSEIVDAAASDWRLADPIPHLVVSGEARELKVGHRARSIPLLGVSLEAARRIAARGGCVRYAGKATGWSNAVNKYLRANGLAETPRHSAYSLRHYVEDALLDAGVDILGHKYGRPRYGEGGGLEVRKAALSKIAL